MAWNKEVLMRLVRRAFAMLVFLMMPDIAAAAQMSKTVENIAPRPHRAPSGISSEQLVEALTLAAGDMGWRILEEAPGEVTAITLVRGKHEAVVTIGYDESNFWINYKDSKNLNYDPKDYRRGRPGQRRVVTKGPRIHPNYNRWVAALADQIVVRTSNPPNPSRESPVLIADELDKLDELRQRGVLTQEEFDQQKAKLLNR
jgi:hypothetical protein